VRLLYLSRVPTGGFFSRPCTYQLSLHVGEDARSDPPPQPGRHSTAALEGAPPQLAAPEEEALRARIKQAIDAMRENVEPPTQKDAGADDPPLDCRFRQRVAVRLDEAGPGPAAGGPAYFRVDVWIERQGGTLFARERTRELWARTFVPLTEPRWQRRPCTWPAVNAAGRDVAYLTCEFAFAHAPAAVPGLQVEAGSSESVALSWRALPSDRAAPLLGYRVEACALYRASRPQNGVPDGLLPQQSALVPYRSGGGGSSGSGAPPPTPPSGWTPVGEYEPMAEPRIVARGLTSDTRYRFRVRGFSEAGAGEVSEIDVDTAPSAPGPCGQPRLAGCSGPVLAVEWDGPGEDGGMDIVAYRVWVRPYSASRAEISDWLEVGHVRHDYTGVQRMEIHTEDLSPSISRYLCCVAAINGAGEVGPMTPDAICLPFPNPCSICGPSPQARTALPYQDEAGDFFNAAQDYEGLATVTLMEPGRRSLAMPILPPGYGREIAGELHLEQPYRDSLLPCGRHGYASGLEPSYSSFHDPPQDWAGRGLGPRSASFHPMNYPGAGCSGSFANDVSGFPMSPMGGNRGFGDELGHCASQDMERDILAQKLEEMRAQLDASLLRYSQVGNQLKYSPDNELLRQSHEEAEIEAAGFQAEVAVLSQHLSELDDANARRLRSTPKASFNLELGNERLPYSNFR